MPTVPDSSSPALSTGEQGLTHDCPKQGEVGHQMVEVHLVENQQPARLVLAPRLTKPPKYDAWVLEFVSRGGVFFSLHSQDLTHCPFCGEPLE